MMQTMNSMSETNQHGGVGLDRMPPSMASDVGQFTDELTPGQYDAFFKAITLLARVDRDSFKGILDITVLKSEQEKLYANQMLRCGMVQLNAPCNNRLDQLKVARMQLQTLLEFRGYRGIMNENPDPTNLDKFRLMLPLPLAEIKAITTDDEGYVTDDDTYDMVKTVQDLQNGIRRDEGTGYFRDHGQFKRLFHEVGVDALTIVNGSKEIDAPYFLLELDNFCATRSPGGRDSRVTALMGRIGMTREGTGISFGISGGRGQNNRRRGVFNRGGNEAPQENVEDPQG